MKSVSRKYEDWMHDKCESPQPEQIDEWVKEDIEGSYKRIAEAIRYIMVQEPITKALIIEDINEYLDQLTGVIVIGGADVNIS